MQNFFSAPVRLHVRTLAILLFSVPAVCAGAPAKVHSVALGTVRKVSWTRPERAVEPPDSKGKAVALPMLKVRPLIVDGRQKEWTTGDAHDVTDRSFTIRRALRLNDTLQGDTGVRWSWQPGPWLLVDRSTGRITALHLPNFDNVVSEAVWFRDYAAYCGTGTTTKGGLFMVVAQLGARRAVVQKQIGKWPQPQPAMPVCNAAAWQRAPMRVTLQSAEGEPMTFSVVGSASLIEEGDGGDQP